MNRKATLVITLLLIVVLSNVFMVAAQTPITVSSAVTSFQVQNTDATDGTVSVAYYLENGTEDADAAQSLLLPKGGNINVYQPAVANLDDGFRGSVVLSADVSVGAIGAQLISWDNGKQGAANYSGLNENEIGQTFYLPTLLKNFGGGGYSTEIVVQNVGTGSANVTVKYYNSSDGSEVAAAQENVTIPENGSATIKQADNASLTDGFIGGGVVSASTGEQIAVIANSYNNEGRLTSYNGFKSGATSFFAPTVTRAFGGSLFSTSTQIMAIDPGTTAITLTYRSPTGAISGIHTTNLSQFQSVNYYQGTDSALSDGFIGGATVEASGNVVMVVNSQATVPGLIDTVSYNAIAGGATKYYLPSISKRFGGGNYISSYQIFNADPSGTAADVSIKYFDDGTEVTAATTTLSGASAIPQYGSTSVFLGSVSALDDGKVYSMIIESTNGQNLVVIGNSKGYAVNGDGSTSYNGIQ